MKMKPSPGLKAFRAGIDRLDRDIVHSLARRMTLAGRLCRLKKSVRDFKREEWVLANAERQCRRHGLDFSVAEPVFREIMRQSAAVQRFLRGEARPVKALLLGGDTACSISPEIHALLGRRAGVPVQYFRANIDLSELSGFLDFCSESGIFGLNVTTPLKTYAARFARLDPAASAIGAVNVLSRESGKWFGYNTDADGLSLSLAGMGVSFAGADVALLGAGGAARAAIFAAGRGGARSVTIYNRTLARAKECAKHFGRLFPDSLFIARGHAGFGSAKAHLFIKAAPDEAYRAGSLKRRGEGFALDMSYGPVLSPFLRDASRAGYGIIRGETMLVYQAMLSFEIWSGLIFDDREAEAEMLMRRLAGKGLAPLSGEETC